MIRLASVVCVLTSCLVLHAGEAKKDTELKWAKGVLTDFVHSAKNQEFDQAEILMTRELKEALEKRTVPGIRGWIIECGIESASMTFSAEDLSPDQDEAVYRGTFKKDKEEAEFTFRLVKEKDNLKWRVAYLSCGKWVSPKVEPKK